MDFTKAFTLKNGDVITIAAHTDDRVGMALRLLKKKNIKIEGFDADLEKNLEFKLALASVLLVKVETKTPAGDLAELPLKDHPDFLSKRPTAADWVITKSKEVQLEAAQYFEVEEKNS